MLGLLRGRFGPLFYDLVQGRLQQLYIMQVGTASDESAADGRHARGLGEHNIHEWNV